MTTPASRVTAEKSASRVSDERLNDEQLVTIFSESDLEGEWNIEATAEDIAKGLSQVRGGRFHEPTYRSAKAGALEALKCAQYQHKIEIALSRRSLDTADGVDPVAWGTEVLRSLSSASASDGSKGVGQGSVFELYATDPDGAGKSSYLYDHYKRGVAGIMEPKKTAVHAHEAWRAGRHRAALASEGREDE